MIRHRIRCCFPSWAKPRSPGWRYCGYLSRKEQGSAIITARECIPDKPERGKPEWGEVREVDEYPEGYVFWVRWGE